MFFYSSVFPFKKFNGRYAKLPFHYHFYTFISSQPSYRNPLVAVKLLNIPKNQDMTIVCRVVGAGITSDNPHDPYEGKVEFKIRIQN